MVHFVGAGSGAADLITVRGGRIDWFSLEDPMHPQHVGTVSDGLFVPRNFALSRLLDVPAAIRLSRATLRNIHENLFWAFFYNTIGIPLAAGVFIPLGLTLSPMFGAAAMSLSSFCVVSNALRLNLFKLRDARHDHKRHSNQNPVARTKEEPKTMKKTMHITGMMCGHCEARVKKALEAVDGVDEALVSHEAGTAVVTLSKDVADETLKQAVEAQDYPVTGIE